jgi:hypothetical protein
VRIVEITAPEEDTTAARADLATLLASLRPVAYSAMRSVGGLCDQVHSSRCPQEDHLRNAPPGGVEAKEVVPVAGPTGEQARTALDKLRQLELAEKAGFVVPPWTHADVDHVANHNPPFRGPGQPPWFVKPALAVEEREGRLVRPSVGSPRRRRGARDRRGLRRSSDSAAGDHWYGRGVFGLATEGESWAGAPTAGFG